MTMMMVAMAFFDSAARCQAFECYSYKHVRDTGAVGRGREYTRIERCREGINSCLILRGTYEMPGYYMDMTREFIDGGCGPFGTLKDMQLMDNLRDLGDPNVHPEEV